jgi:putative ABC transport system permease protein
MWPAAAGVVAGVAASLVTARLLETVAFGVSARDPLTIGAVAGCLLLVALLATLVPAFRASRVDPLIALRAE